MPTLRSILGKIDPSLPLADPQTLNEMVTDSVAWRRFNTLLLASLAGVALFLSLIGIYGVQAYSVTRRTSEIGLRVAMCARPRQLLRLIVGQGMQPAALGIVLGLAGAFALSRLMTQLLF
ncbi:MAG: ABC transporter permease, partial [Actinomycetia bacterium]|nr:ABC transporter permease [Actinomycetes bacterium]